MRECEADKRHSDHSIAQFLSMKRRNDPHMTQNINCGQIFTMRDNPILLCPNRWFNRMVYSQHWMRYCKGLNWNLAVYVAGYAG